MDVYVVRHAIAHERDASRWSDDGERPLTPEGEARFRKAARGLRRLVPTVDVVLSSPFARAWRTAELLEEEAAWPRPVRCEELAADRSATDAMSVIRSRATEAAVAVVGHEPGLSELASLLLAGSTRVAFDLKKGGVIALGLADGVRRGSGYLRWVVTPKILRSLSG
jgi:phosphohistidine phosphatase